MKFRCLLASLPLLWGASADAGPRVAAEDLRIGIAPFAATSEPSRKAASNAPAEDPDLGGMLAERLDERGLGSVVPPAEFPRSSPDKVEASEVRRWASRSRVDTVVVGHQTSGGAGIEIEAQLRSGHSGAVLSRYAVHAKNAEGLQRASEELAEQILAGLGYEPPAASEESAGAAGEGGKGKNKGKRKEKGEGDSDKDGFLIGGAKRNEPISIRSDELEMIQPPGGPRKVIFTDNVVVEQGAVRLTADELTAVYPEGSSQPEELIAVGTVLVQKGDKEARCDRARYRRAEDRIICTGHAELVERCDRVRGDEIHIDLVKERVRVLGAPSVVVHPDDSKATDRCIGAKS